MRSCQICGEPDKRLLFDKYDSQEGMGLFECDGCGHRYVDGDHLSQNWFDRYYTIHYHTTDGALANGRYRSLAAYVKLHAGEVLDVGGRNGTMHEHFSGFPYRAVGIGDSFGEGHECVMLSHTLEHVYDVTGFMKAIRKALKVDGLLVAEVPIHLHYRKPKEYDYHFQHVNKFRRMDLMSLFSDNQYSIVEFCQLPDFREYECWRIAGRLW